MRGKKWIMEMDMEMVLILMVVLMEEPSRGDSGSVSPL
jgi:hypothetical protein